MTPEDLRKIEAVKAFYISELSHAALDIVWHVPGHNPVSGAYRGHAEYFEVMPARMVPLKSWVVQRKDVMVNGDRVVATFHLTAERKGGQIELDGAHVFRLNEVDQVAEGWGFTNQQELLDEFFAA